MWELNDGNTRYMASDVPVVWLAHKITMFPFALHSLPVTGIDV